MCSAVPTSCPPTARAQVQPQGGKGRRHKGDIDINNNAVTAWGLQVPAMDPADVQRVTDPWALPLPHRWSLHNYWRTTVSNMCKEEYKARASEYGRVCSEVCVAAVAAPHTALSTTVFSCLPPPAPLLASFSPPSRLLLAFSLSSPPLIFHLCIAFPPATGP
jgi:hypothetical protein